jgi:hypothetical protein
VHVTIPLFLFNPQARPRPTPAVVGTQPELDARIEVDVENSARPVAAGSVHVLPIFPWSEASTGNFVTHSREGGWVRFYLLHSTVHGAVRKSGSPIR